MTYTQFTSKSWTSHAMTPKYWRFYNDASCWCHLFHLVLVKLQLNEICVLVMQRVDKWNSEQICSVVSQLTPIIRISCPTQPKWLFCDEGFDSRPLQFETSSWTIILIIHINLILTTSPIWLYRHLIRWFIEWEGHHCRFTGIYHYQ